MYLSFLLVSRVFFLLHPQQHFCVSSGKLQPSSHPADGQGWALLDSTAHHIFVLKIKPLFSLLLIIIYTPRPISIYSVFLINESMFFLSFYILCMWSSDSNIFWDTSTAIRWRKKTVLASILLFTLCASGSLMFIKNKESQRLWDFTAADGETRGKRKKFSEKFWHVYLVFPLTKTEIYSKEQENYSWEIGSYFLENIAANNTAVARK